MPRLLLAAAAVFVLLQAPAQAALMNQAKMRGKVYDMNRDVVTLETVTGKVKVPRKFFNEKRQSLRPGQNVLVMVNLSEVIAANKKR